MSPEFTCGSMQYCMNISRFFPFFPSIAARAYPAGIAIQFLTMKWEKKLRDHIVMVPCGGGDAGALCDIVYMLDLW